MRVTKDWELVRLGDVGTYYSGLSGKGGADFGHGQGRYVPFLDVITDVSVSTANLEAVDIDPTERQNQVQKGDLLLNTSSESPEEVAMCSVVEFARPNTYLNSFCFGFRLVKNLDPRFLAYLIRSPIGRRAIAPLAQGSTRYNISKRAFSETRVKIPDFPEQQLIASTITDIDHQIEALQNLLHKKRDVASSMRNELLTGDTRLPGFSSAWKTSRVGDTGTWLKGRGITRAEIRPDGIPCVRYGEIYTSFNDVIKQTVSFVGPKTAGESQMLNFGDILFTASGETAEEIGKCAAYSGSLPAVAGGDIIILRDHRQDPVFLSYVLNSPGVANQKARLGQGNAVVHISAANLGRMELRLPELSEQHAIAEVLTDIDDELEGIERRIEKTRDVKSAVMDELLSGRTRLV